ncbi:HEAT repeat domain-containing protein [candidate division CSSED10-310 bacterium]|uniref:HEAT repeat domain-containing protein n=1 Tax=candidate division CSSED10-310 bacterium TaxID=2855610 RepID=A0ABV6Z6L2_UNCC1
MARKIRFLLILSFCCTYFLACQSREEKYREILKTFEMALNSKDIENGMKYRKKLIGSGADAVPVMMRVLPGKSGTFKSEIMYILEKLGEPAVHALIETLPSEEANVKLHILSSLESLGNIKAVRGLEKFQQTLGSSDPLQVPTAKTLATLGSDKGFQILNNLLVSSDRDTRLNTAMLYSELADNRSLSALLKVIRSEEDRLVKNYIVEAIGKLKNIKTVPILKKYALNDKKSVLVRESAAIAISRITGESCQYHDDKGKSVYPRKQ